MLENLPLDRKPKADDISIEAATADDAPAIHALLTDLARTLDAVDKFHSSADDLRRYGFGETAQFEALLAKADGKPIGLALYFFTFSSWRGSPGVYVQDLHVLESFRAGGIGRRLLAMVAERGRAAGCAHLRLSVDAGNASGRAFYDRLGFHHRHDETIYEITDAGFARLAQESGRKT